MRVEIRPINVKGKPLLKAERQKLAPCRGVLRLFENRLHAFGRAVMCATLTSVTDGTETELLPELVDAQVIWMDDKVIRVRGVEQVVCRYGLRRCRSNKGKKCFPERPRLPYFPFQARMG